MKYPDKSELPKLCPFCNRIDGVEWSEFKVRIIEDAYFDSETSRFVQHGEDFEVYCSRCEEHLRREDYALRCANCGELIKGKPKLQDDVEFCSECDEQMRGSL